MYGFKNIEAFKNIFTWNKQTFGTFLKTLFTGTLVGKDEYVTNIIKIKLMKGGFCIPAILKQQKYLNWYLWIHHKRQNSFRNEKKNILQKNMLQIGQARKTVTNRQKSKKLALKRNMKLGNSAYFLKILIIFFSFQLILHSEEKITSTPLINLEKIKPSFEELEEKNEINLNNNSLKEKKKLNNSSNIPQAVLIGLDKITAKSSKIILDLNKVKKFGPLEIKILKCGKIKKDNKIENIAYLQVKDLSNNDDEKVFIFNGWTFSSDPTLAPFDHAIYDLQLVKCYNT